MENQNGETMTASPNSPEKNRQVFILRVWQRAGKSGEWIGELVDVSRGETEHIYGLEKLLARLKNKLLGQVNEGGTPPTPESS